MHPLGGDELSLGDQLTMFHLVGVVLDPYTYESSWILDTAARVLHEFSGADCRAAWIVTADEAGVRSFLGPLAERFPTFCDADREFVTASGLDRLPAFIHVALDGSVVGRAEGWNPDEWKAVAASLAEQMSWSVPHIPLTGDPVPYAGSPALPA